MNIDIGRQLGAVTRGVSNREVEGKPARAVTMVQTYATSPGDLWSAITTADRIPRWLAPIEGDLRLGGRYQLKGNAGGEILVCEPPRHVRVTWEFGGGMSWVEAWIESLTAKSSRLTIEHLAFVDEHWKKFGPGAVGIGWDLMLAGLDRHLESGASVNPEEGMAWMMSDEGKAFMRQSSDAWCAADIAGGAEPNGAKAAAVQTIAAYTGA
jgi:uncharacterized protein YndB with AHSA1/START domain